MKVKSIKIGDYEGMISSAPCNFVTGYYESTYTEYHPITEEYIIPRLPKNINTIIDFGCANCNNFIPFQNKIKDVKCVGFDLSAADQINFVCSKKNLTYYQCSIQDFVKTVNNWGNKYEPIDWANSLVWTQGTLLYVNKDGETDYCDRFVQTLLDLGCKNIFLHEYTEGWDNTIHGFVKFSEKYKKLFKIGEPDEMSHVMMEKK